MNRAHQHGHHHHLPSSNLAFAWGIALNLGFVVVEAGFGYRAGSLALITDAGHNLSDVLALLLAWAASWMATRTAGERLTYGYSRGTILASLVSGLLLMLVVGGIVWEAIGRLQSPAPIEGMTIIWVAGIGVIINTATALLFVKDKDRDLNRRGAYLHMAADALVSLGVVIGGIVMLLTGLNWIDPVLSLLIAAIILYSTWGLLVDAVKLAFDAVPAHIDLAEVRRFLTNIPGVVQVHDLHVWAMSTTDTALTAHLVMEVMPENDELLSEANEQLESLFSIGHSTLQVERGRRHSCGNHG